MSANGDLATDRKAASVADDPMAADCQRGTLDIARGEGKAAFAIDQYVVAENQLTRAADPMDECSSPHAATVLLALVMLGDGPIREHLNALANELGIGSHIRFEGRVDSAGVVRWLQASDVFALVSSKEGFSCSLIEAMAAGLPSVVSAIPANTQLIEHGVDGLLAPVLDTEAVAANVVELLKIHNFEAGWESLPVTKSSPTILSITWQNFMKAFSTMS